ncbi:EPIDERMAL PATTERNING FACTOR-like protein 4 [Phragmites australis]|uniref:EPIDERMAL PATTERNING FACTOR-like protein 4 n=1 Tax=Phragmites australis TaxID=29695 RepID=UPI002D768B8D|nr:EPIDERMAL PATTERNING FACTOR-like protein 4 [Phragmites australis]
MGWPSRRRGRRRSISAALLVLLTFFAAAITGTCTSARGGGNGVAPEEYSWDPVTMAARRGLVGPGSSPPTCHSRCGGCHPCRPVHVAIQPGRSFPLEYYPEAWRCKCGNKLFMP